MTTKDLAFAQLTRRIKPLKGDYFRIAKDVALKAHEEENKASATILPSGTASATLAEKLARLAADVKCSNIELFFLRRKFDENDQPVVRDGVGMLESKRSRFTASMIRPGRSWNNIWKHAVCCPC